MENVSAHGPIAPKLRRFAAQIALECHNPAKGLPQCGALLDANGDHPGVITMRLHRHALRQSRPALLLSPPLLASFSLAILCTALIAVFPGRATELSLLAALLCAVTPAWWRYHRRDLASPRRIGRRI